MASQVIQFFAPSGLTLTLDAATLSSDTLALTANACTEASNRKGLYTSSFTGTLAGRYMLTMKSGSVVVGNDLVSMLNADGTYPSDSLRQATEVYRIPRATSEKVAGASTTRTNTSETPNETLTETLA